MTVSCIKIAFQVFLSKKLSKNGSFLLEIMNKYFLRSLIDWPRSYISGTALTHILAQSANARYAIVKRAVKEGYLIPVRRDLYIIKGLKKPLINSFELALMIQGPSYISFESALSYHGWIPEAVRTTTCASVKRSQEFDTSMGIFSYKHIPTDAFSLGVKAHKQNGTFVLIATPIKALADIIYVRKKSWASVRDLLDDLRIEPENFRNIDPELLADLVKNYPSLRVRKALAKLQKGLIL